MPTHNLIEVVRRVISRNEVLLILLAATIWIPSLENSYFLSDDFVHLEDWGLPPLSQIWVWFYSEYAGFFRPLTALWWKSQYLLWGLNPFGYQLSNLFLHILCTLLVRDLSRQLLSEQPNAALWSALLFLFLPGHIFGVLMISALTGLLCTVFYLAAITAYLRRHTLLSLLAFLLSLLTKELALSLPLLIAAWEAIRQHSNEGFTGRIWLRTVAPYLFVGAGYIAIRYFVFGHLPHSPMHENAHPLRLFTNVFIYVAQMATPWGLQELKPFFRGHPNILLVAATTGAALSLFILIRHRRAFSVEHLYALMWVGITLAPVARLYSPWNTYLPAVGMALLLGSLASKYKSRLNYTILALFLGLSIIHSVIQQQHWQRARLLCKQVTESIAEQATTSPDVLYIANLPAEWNGAPLLVGDWVLEKALLLKGLSGRIVALSNIIHFNQREPIAISQTNAQAIELKIESTAAFFRLETMEVLSGQLPPHLGYTYNKGDARIKVTGLNEQNQPNQLHIDMGDASRLQQIWIWDGHRLRKRFP